MKRNKLILGSLSMAAVVAATMIWNQSTSSQTAKYVAKDLSALKARTGAKGAEEFLAAQMIDAETGEVITSEKYNQIMNELKLAPKADVIQWNEEGPANIGGRTRAILIDHQNINNVWAGSVSGGLYYSPSRANYWERNLTYPGTMMISSMAQDQAGNIYVATGHTGTGENENAIVSISDGLYVSPDKGVTWEQVPGTSSIAAIREVVSSKNSNKIFFTAGSNLKSWTYGDASTENVTTGVSGTRGALAMSEDGQVIVCSMSNKTVVSTDGGVTWTDESGNGDGEMKSTGFTRIEYAISKKKTDGTHTLYASLTTGSNAGQWVSRDNGSNWYEHTGASTQGSALDIFRNQGSYNSTITVDPTDSERIIVGGIDLWSWKQTVSNPTPSGAWDQISEWYVDPTSSSETYVHADNHELKWNSANELFIGNDGGVGVSLDKGTSFYPANRGYNVTQFYGIGFDKNGAVIGGAQDNGTLYNDHSNATYQDFVEVTGGDGFDCEISFYNPKVMFSTLYYGDIFRSGDGGESFSAFPPNLPGTQYAPVGTEGSVHPFKTSIKLAEYYDVNSEDSVLFVARQNYLAGEEVRVPSFSTGDSITYITQTNLYFDDTLHFEPSLTTTDYSVENAINGIDYDLGINPYTPFITASGSYPPVVGDSLLVDTPSGMDTVVVASVEAYTHYFGENAATGEQFDLGRDTLTTDVAWDTITVQDPFQSWLVLYVASGTGEIWGTRDALRFSELLPQWYKIADGVGNTFGGVDVEFSEDLNEMYVAAGGSVKRVSGLGSIYTSNPNFGDLVDVDETPATTVTTISGAGGIRAIGMSPENPDVLFASTGSFNGSVFKSTNASSASPSFTSLGSESTAFYDFVVDRDDENLVIAATANGAMVSENGGGSWAVCAGGAEGFAGVPAFSVYQNWRDNGDTDLGNKREGEIYIGTFGRGIFSSASVLGLPDESTQIGSSTNKEAALSIYPNPLTSEATLAFELTEASKVDIMIFNLSGRLVKRINNTSGNAGQNTVQFNASDLPSGTYLVKFRAGNKQQNGKFIKM